MATATAEEDYHGHNKQRWRYLATATVTATEGNGGIGRSGDHGYLGAVAATIDEAGIACCIWPATLRHMLCCMYFFTVDTEPYVSKKLCVFPLFKENSFRFVVAT